jgi:hypothetical protein
MSTVPEFVILKAKTLSYRLISVMSVEFFTNENDKNAIYCHKRLRKDEKTQPLLTLTKSMIGVTSCTGQK